MGIPRFEFEQGHMDKMTLFITKKQSSVKFTPEEAINGFTIIGEDIWATLLIDDFAYRFGSVEYHGAVELKIKGLDLYTDIELTVKKYPINYFVPAFEMISFFPSHLNI